MPISAVRTALVPGPDQGSQVMLELSSTDRCRGVGCAAGDEELLAELDREIAPDLLGSDPTLIEARLHALPTAASREARCAVELALWDLLGQLAEAPLHQIWGGHSQRLPGMGQLGPADEAGLARQAEQLAGRGFRALVVDVPPGSSASSFLTSAGELRRTLGPEFGLAARWLSASSAADADLLRLVAGLEELDTLWLELPGGESAERLETIRSRARTLMIVAGAPDLPGLERLVRSECCDILRPPAQLMSMLTLWKVAGLAESANLGFLTPPALTPLAAQAGLHLSLAVPACDWVILGAPGTRTGLPDSEGWVAASPEPGFGFRCDPALFSDSGVPAARW